MAIATQVAAVGVGKSRGYLHEVDDQLADFRSLTKWCHLAMSAEEIPTTVRNAFASMRQGRLRPTALKISSDVLDASADVNLEQARNPAPAKPDPTEVQSIAARLTAAELPVI